jgi:cytochrome bd-type quinol oxidase subunit 2
MLALAWTIVLGLVWLFVPAGQSASVSASTDGTTVIETSRSTLLETEGASVVVVLAVPVVIAAFAVATAGSTRARRIRFTCGGLLLMGCLLGAASIGLPYVPAAAALLVSGALTRQRAPVAGR